MKNFVQIILAFTFIIGINKLRAQDPTIVWQKVIGGSSNDEAFSVKQTADSGFIAAGYSQSTDGDVTGNHGYADFWIVKFGYSGSIVWKKSFGGSGDDRGYSAQQTADGQFIVAGYNTSNDGDVTGNHYAADYWIIKLDTTGNLIWQKSLGGHGNDAAYSIQQIKDGGFIVSGSSRSNDGDVFGNHGEEDYWIVKLDSAGNLIWQKSLGGSKQEYPHSIQQTTDGGFIVAGGTFSDDGDVVGFHGGGDAWIVKLDTIGNVEWQKSLGGSGGDNANSIQQTIDGGFIVAGNTESNDGDVSGNHGYVDSWIVKLDMTGNVVWQKCLGGTDEERANSIQQIAGGYIIAGVSFSNDGNVSLNHGSSDLWIVKIDTAGTIIWEKSLGGSSPDWACSIQQTTHDDFIIAGLSTSNDGDIPGNQGLDDYWIVNLSCAQLLLYADVDGDGFGNGNDSIHVCAVLAGYVSNSSDCDDTNPAVHPGTAEIINGIDDDCDGLIDEMCSAGFTLYPDTLIPHHYWAVNLAAGIPPLGYYWSWGDSSYDSIAYPSHTYANSGFYTICLAVQDSAGCSSNYCNAYNIQKMSASEAANTIINVDVVDSIPDIATIIQNIKVLQSWSVYPNPVAGPAYIRYSLSQPANVTIDLFNILGKQVYSVINNNQPAGESISVIDTRELQNGIYLLQICASGQIAEQKIVVMN